MLTKQFVKDSLGWGVVLWFVGWLLGVLLFFILPPTLIGWVILPIGLALAVWVLLRRVKGTTLSYYLLLAAVWTAIALLFDYLFIVKMFHSQAYYKLDVYVYYAATFLLPLAVGLWKGTSKHK